MKEYVKGYLVVYKGETNSILIVLKWNNSFEQHVMLIIHNG